MKLAIDRYVETGEPIILPLTHGTWAGRRVAIFLETCGDPTCGCAKIDFYCRPFSGEQVPTDDHPALIFALDVWDRCVADPEAGELSREARSLGKAVMCELEEQDWQNLFDYLTLVKRDVLKTVDVSALEVEFPPEIMDGDDCEVGYNEIFPYAELSSFGLGDCTWTVEDQYCVDPDCDCAEVRLTFVGQPRGADVKKLAANDSMPEVVYDYRGGKVGNVDSEPQAGQPAIEELLQAAKAGNPAFDREVETRHVLVRKLFMKALHRTDVAAVPLRREEAKIGRNDPCPCGSGEKYKKCCGMQDEDGKLQ
ncbi:MAG: SEC-C metal-binding domain-containing protein [bacterium]